MPVQPPDNCVDLLKNLVGFDTVNRVREGRLFVEQALIDYVAELARAWGLAATRLPIADEGENLLVSYEVDKDAPWLLFDSHLDTVGVEGMTIDPFAGEVREGRLWGRGACDTKGTGAAMLWAARGLVDRRAAVNNIAILFAIDEEVSKTGIQAFVSQQLPTLGWRPRGVVVGEPTQLQLITAHMGVVRWKIRTRGIAAHSSDPGRGRSAISAMMRVVDAIEQRYIPNLQSHDPLAGQAACSINLIQGGTQINVIPALCEIEIDRRIVPGEVATDVVPEVKEILDELRREYPEIDVEHSSPLLDPALSSESNQTWASRVGTVLESCHLSSRPAGAGYGTHASNYAAVGLPAVVLGPGDIVDAHSAEESLSLAELEQGIEVYTRLMELQNDETT